MTATVWCVCRDDWRLLPEGHIPMRGEMLGVDLDAIARAYAATRVISGEPARRHGRSQGPGDQLGHSPYTAKREDQGPDARSRAQKRFV